MASTAQAIEPFPLVKHATPHYRCYRYPSNLKGTSMPRPTHIIDEIIRSVVAQAIQQVAPAIQRHVAALAAEELEKCLALKPGAKRAIAPSRSARARSRQELTTWVADRRARRVPTFVIEMTGGLDTKKRIVAKFGEGAVFEKGKPAPKSAKAA